MFTKATGNEKNRCQEQHGDGPQEPEKKRGAETTADNEQQVGDENNKCREQ